MLLGVRRRLLLLEIRGLRSKVDGSGLQPSGFRDGVYMGLRPMLV
jgi:hypothetical protein